VAAVDWPVAAFWKEISQAFPDAIPVLSIRDDRQEWWDSVDQTILGVARRDPDPAWGDWQELFHDLLRDRWGLSAAEGWGNAAAAIAAYDHHNEEVRATAPADRLVVWRPADGWAPICRALGVAIPDEPFPHVNTRAEWAAGSDAAGA
jgi:hypothetical protein